MSESVGATGLLCQFCHNSDKYCRCLMLEEDEEYYQIFEDQSGESKTVANISMGNGSIKSQNVAFMDQNPAWKYEVDDTMDPSFGAADTDDVDLGKFFERPVIIHETDWSTTDPVLAENFNPWTAFCENPRIINRLNNFMNARFKLHLKFVINGNGFYYGRAIAAYTPLPLNQSFTPIVLLDQPSLIQASQRPHIYLDPTSSMGGELVLPFFWWNNALNIPRADWRQMGELDMMSLAPLRHANGADGVVRITVFAWAEDMTLSTPTNFNSIGLVNQSGESDEYGKPISGPATALANAAGALKQVPLIGPYARASQLALSKIAGAAAIFGYCRPAEEESIKPFKPMYAGNLANTNVPDSCQKLTTDLKQETTVDPRTTGLGSTDEMSIKSIVTRESYYTQFPWDTADQTGAKLFSTVVTPFLWQLQTDPSGPNDRYHLLPCTHAAMMFENWRGTMNFRFQVVASNFHRGRIQVQYDPYNSDTNEFNVAFNRIIDISEERDFTITVGWGIPETYGERTNPGVSQLPYRIGSANIAYPATNRNQYNGQLSVWVLNDLTSPSSDAGDEVTVNVFASAGEDMELVNPTDDVIDSFTYFQTPPEPEPENGEEVLENQSGEMALAAPDQEATSEPSRPVMGEVDTEVAAAPHEDSPLSAICFGERITSMRSLIKRFTVHEIFGPTSEGFTTPGRFYRYFRRSQNFPYYRGADPNGIHESTRGPYNYVNQTPLNWLTPAYSGWRGGIRHKFVVLNTDTNGHAFNGLQYVNRNARFNQTYSTNTAQFFTEAANPNFMGSNIGFLDSGFAGAAIQPANENPAIEVEIPYHNHYRFVPAKVTSNSVAGRAQSHAYEYNYLLRKAQDGTSVVILHSVAAADDFSLFFYTGVPPVYYNSGATNLIPAP